eukprot:SM000180S03511  [mRNA]  locus=s180:188772:191032:- [translate_table: standard]
MIKRRNYRLLHGSDGGGEGGSASGSSSSSSDSSSGVEPGGGDEPWPGEHAAVCAGAEVLPRLGSRLRTCPSEHDSDVESPDADHASARTVEPRSEEGGPREARARRGRSVRVDEKSASETINESGRDAAEEGYEDEDAEESEGIARSPEAEEEEEEEEEGEKEAEEEEEEDEEEEEGQRLLHAPPTALKRQWAEAVLEDDDEGSNVCRSDTELEAQMEEGGLVLCVGAAGRVLKCRICPQAVCLSEKSMEAHLASKGHARSLKKSREGRLAVMLNSEGEEEEATETHTERLQRLSQAAARMQVRSDRNSRGRQRQRKRAKLKVMAAKEGATSAEATAKEQNTPLRKGTALARPSAIRAAAIAGAAVSSVLQIKPGTKKLGRTLRKRTR